MGSFSSIEWTTHTFNPWWGCTKVSDGCKHCYAETLAKRYNHKVWGPTAERRLMSDNYWRNPLIWNKQAEKENIRFRVFCASMADVFEERAPLDQRERLWDIIKQTPFLDWQILTKRPERIIDALPSDWGDGYDNVWLGTSIEDSRVIHRISHLIKVPATIHFLSIEPLIGPIHPLPLTNIQWVIVGGESGPGARPMEREWVIDIRNQCQSARVPFFFKQWGGVNKKKNGRDLDGTTYNDIPQIVSVEEVAIAA